jgi:hypothetical protein
MEPLGHINTTEIIKVERQSSGAGVNWLIFDQSRNHVEIRAEELMSPHVQEALGHESEGYFQGDWSAQGWKIGDNVLPPKGW